MKIFRCPKSGRFPVLFYQLHLKVHPVAGMRCILLWKINRQSIGKSFLMIPFALSSPGNLHIFCAKTPVPFSIPFYLIEYRPKVLKKSPSSLTSCRKGQGCQSHLRLIAGNRLLLIQKLYGKRHSSHYPILCLVLKLRKHAVPNPNSHRIGKGRLFLPHSIFIQAPFLMFAVKIFCQIIIILRKSGGSVSSSQIRNHLSQQHHENRAPQKHSLHQNKHQPPKTFFILNLHQTFSL